MTGGGTFLDYSRLPLPVTPVRARYFGILFIESGVTLSVAAALIILFCRLGERSPPMNYPYWVAIGLLMLGLYTMIAHHQPLKKAVGMTILPDGDHPLLPLMAVKRDATLPIVSSEDVDPAHFMNPLPHALMLTAIVVMVATSGVALAILIRLYARYGSLEEDVIARSVASDETEPA
jgi:multicomponent Na+:H+ antiporter subunit C